MIVLFYLYIDTRGRDVSTMLMGIQIKASVSSSPPSSASEQLQWISEEITVFHNC